jgi:hypothetical protein
VIIFKPCRSQYPRHRPVVVHDFADDTGRIETGQTRKVDCRLGLPRATQDPASARTQWEDVTRLDEIAEALARVDRHLNRARPVGGRDAGADSLSSLDRDREGGPVGRLVALGHRTQPQFVAALLGETQTDQSSAVRRHEVDRLRRRELGRDGQVAFVLAVGRIDHHDQLPLADVLDRFLDRCEGG